MRKAGKGLQKTGRAIKLVDGGNRHVARKLAGKRAEPVNIFDRVRALDESARRHMAHIIEETVRPETDRNLGRVENYKRLLESGEAAKVQQVIAAAHYRDGLADVAMRQHIAELIDQGREQELTTQLRAYAVMHLITPMQVMRRRDSDSA
jgi:hypothetical protein